jgi:hypothetical protein
MATRYDHFHATWRKGDDTGEIEGGWTGYPEDWEIMDKGQQESWHERLCLNWGMPIGAKVERIWLAG